MAIGSLHWPLSRKILGLALLNLLLAAAALIAFASWQFGLSRESLLLGPGRDRILAIANAAGRDLDEQPFASRPQLLASYAQRYGADFYLVDPRGESLTGEEVELPAALLARLHQRPRRFDDGGPPPPGLGEFGPPGVGAGPSLDRVFLTISHNPMAYWIGVRIPTAGPNGERGMPGVLLIRARSIFNTNLFLDLRLLLCLAATLAAVALFCWWPFIHGMTRAIRQLDQVTQAIADGYFDRVAALQRGDELGHLGQQIDRMAERLKWFVQNQKRFLGDISHELSAPIARIQFALGILEQRVDAAQQQHVDVLREEVQEMSALVHELLTFSKAGMQPEQTPLRAVDLDGVVRQAVGQQMPGLGTIEVNLQPGLGVRAHGPYLVRALSNLLRNAIRYAGDAGPIQVNARRESDRVLISVVDCGPGLPEGSLEAVFAPFYRPESARTRDTGGVGLGLAIVKSCVEACQGTVTCRNRESSGLEVTISLMGAG